MVELIHAEGDYSGLRVSTGEKVSALALGATSCCAFPSRNTGHTPLRISNHPRGV